MQYDTLNRMTGRTGPSGTESTTYAGAEWHRVSSTADGVTTNYVYDGDNVVADVQSGTLARTYVTPFLDQNLGMTDLTGAAPATYYYSQDGLGSVRTLTGGSGMVANRYDYTAFGQAAPAGIHTAGHEAQQTVDQRYTYTGRESTTDPNLMYYRWRMYAPGTGRFVSRDPAGYFRLNLTEFREAIHADYAAIEEWKEYILFENAVLYAYSAHSPISHGDPYGLESGRFEICRRDIQTSGVVETVVNGIANAMGGQHTYVQYTSSAAGADPEGWGFSGGKKGGLPSAEKAFSPTRCWECDRSCTKLMHGSGKGKYGAFGTNAPSAKEATDAEIKDCLKNSPFSQDYDLIRYNCNDWANEATAACGLSCSVPGLFESAVEGLTAPARDAGERIGRRIRDIRDSLRPPRLPLPVIPDPREIPWPPLSPRLF
jgi:RHS repeat-associated protein